MQVMYQIKFMVVSERWIIEICAVRLWFPVWQSPIRTVSCFNYTARWA